MTTLQLYRLSGLSLLIGVVLWSVASIVSGIAFGDNTDVSAATNPFNISLSLVGVIGSILALLGLPGLYARVAREGGVTWLLGVTLTAMAMILFGVFLGLMGVLVFPVLASRAPELFSEGPPPGFFVLFIIATLSNVFGVILMAVAMLARGIYGRWCGYVLLAQAVLAVLGFVANGPGSTSLIGQILGVITPLPLALVLGWAGHSLWSADQRADSVGATDGSVTPPVRQLA